MEILYQAAEFLSTFAESCMMLWFVLAIGNKRCHGNNSTFRFIIFSLIHTISILFLNSFSLFSYITVVLSILIIVLLSRFMSSSSFLLRLTCAFIAMFIFATIDGVVALILGTIKKDVAFAATMISEVGLERSLYIVSVKCIEIALLFVFRREIHKIPVPKNTYLIALFITLLVPFLVMTQLSHAVILGDVLLMQVAVLLSWIIILALIIFIIWVFVLISKTKEQEVTNNLLQSINEMAEKNFKAIDAERRNYHKIQHDNNKHMQTVLSLLDQENGSNHAKEYLNHLINMDEEPPLLCHSGHSVVDAVINVKATTAQEYHIPFDFTASLPGNINIQGTDICAILANQIDNAIEACMAIPEAQQKQIDVKIWQKNCFAFFRVENTSFINPLEKNADLKTTKTINPQRHGYGITNIQETVKKYAGTLQHKYENGSFLSLATIPFAPFDTENHTG